MNEADLTRLTKEYALTEVGADLVGIADALDPEFDVAPKGHKPIERLPNARSIVVIGRKVLSSVLETTPSGMFNKHYEQINHWLDEASYKIVRFLEGKGFKNIWFPESEPLEYLWQQRIAGEKLPCPSISHIRCAVAAGLGIRGRVGVVLTPQFGPRQRWNSVITTAPLVPSPRFQEELCLERIVPGSCGDRCIKICQEKQRGALRPWPEEGGVEWLRCNWTHLRKTGWSCALCINDCPVGRE